MNTHMNMDFLKFLIEKVILRPSVPTLFLGIGIIVLSAISGAAISIYNQNISISNDWRIILLCVGLATAVWGGILLWIDYSSPRPPRPFLSKYKVFLASPMAGFGDNSNNPLYKAQYEDANEVFVALTSHTNITAKKIYFSGKHFTPGQRFEPEETAAKKDLEALRLSEVFIMLYPAKISSSVLFEAGYALALGKRCIYFTPKDVLPFVMRKLDALSSSPTYSKVTIYTCEDVQQIINIIQQEQDNLLQSV